RLALSGILPHRGLELRQSFCPVQPILRSMSLSAFIPAVNRLAEHTAASGETKATQMVGKTGLGPVQMDLQGPAMDRGSLPLRSIEKRAYDPLGVRHVDGREQRYGKERAQLQGAMQGIGEDAAEIAGSIAHGHDPRFPRGLAPEEFDIA